MMNATKKALQDLTLSLRVYAQLELIGVRTLEQLRVLVAMRDKTRSQTVRTPPGSFRERCPPSRAGQRTI
jgi:hypothetical protein